MSRMTAKQKLFCDEYLVDLNATQAAIRAGYSKKNADKIGPELLGKTRVREYIDERLAELESEKIADAKEVMEYFTSVMRGESRSEVVVVEGVGMGESRAKRIMKAPDEKERLEAAKQLSKRYGLNIDKDEQKARLEKLKAETARIKGEDPDEDAEDDGFIEALRGEVKNVWDDE